jgi:hypothetical protein
MFFLDPKLTAQALALFERLVIALEKIAARK